MRAGDGFAAQQCQLAAGQRRIADASAPSSLNRLQRAGSGDEHASGQIARQHRYQDQFQHDEYKGPVSQ
jgi:hypothetical protein